MNGAKRTYRILVVDDEASVQSVVRGRFERRGHEVRVAANGDAAIALAREFKPDVAVCDIRMPGMDGFEVLQALSVPTILITGHGDKESAIRAVETGAFAFFEKPFDLDALEVAVMRGAERHHLEQERRELTAKLERLCLLQDRELEHLEKPGDTTSFLGKAPAMRAVRDTLERIARKPTAPLLVLGETGTGKEVAARELHTLTHGSSKRQPFVALNCSAIPPDLFESELYGHEKGSFSGATNQRIGLAEAAREGTLFLDEVGELEPRHQAKLLRFIQERSFRRVGANRELEFQGRVIAATHRDLATQAKDGSFREDLYYRLAVVSVELPPLRARGEDIDGLIEALCKRHGLSGVHPEHRLALRAYAWPGNVRELNNWIERASILGFHDRSGQITLAPPTSRAPSPTHADAGSGSSAPAAMSGQALDLKAHRARALEEEDRRLIQEALDRHDGNISAAARELGIDRKNLTRRIKTLGLGKKAA